MTHDLTSQRAMRALLMASRSCLEGRIPQIWSVVQDAIQADGIFEDRAAHQLPAADLIDEMATLTNSDTQTLYKSIRTASPIAHWRQGYSRSDGFDEHYLRNYGWFHLISPRGPFRSNRLRLNFGVFGKGLHYRAHWHESDELYLVVAGELVLSIEGENPRTLRPGDYATVRSRQVHTLDTPASPVLLLGLQWGNDILVKSTLVDHKRR